MFAVTKRGGIRREELVAERNRREGNAFPQACNINELVKRQKIAHFNKGEFLGFNHAYETYVKMTNEGFKKALDKL